MSFPLLLSERKARAINNSLTKILKIVSSRSKHSISIGKRMSKGHK